MDSYDFQVDEKVRPAVERALTGTTALDSEVASMPLPESQGPALWSIVVLRGYRAITPRKIRNRCVFDPSCSHYSEMAIREHGVIKGVGLTFGRLRRCKSGNGGIDLTGIKKESIDAV